MSTPASPPRERPAGDVTGRVRVMVYAAAPAADPGAVEEAYHAISRALDGTPGLLGNVLLRSLSDPGAYVVMSEWRDAEAFRDWETTAGHRDTTAPLRPFQRADAAARAAFGIYEVVAAY